MPTLTLTIGLSSNLTLEPLPTDRAAAFVTAVDRLFYLADATVYVRAAESYGEWRDERTGETVREESRTWIAATDEPDVIHAAASDLAAAYEQDAIAITVGQTALVTPTLEGAP